jgi:hypothetical protein
MGFMVWGAAGCQADDGVFIRVSGALLCPCACGTQCRVDETQLRLPLSPRAETRHGLDRHRARLPRRRPTHPVGLLSYFYGHPNYQFLASLLVTAS